MIYITGDTHGDFHRIEQFCEKVQPTSDDVLVILGDAGFNYFLDWRDQHMKKKIAKLPITVFSIHGNHEKRPETIPSYHSREWHGGFVFVEDVYPNILFARDGDVYDLDGKSTLVIGGAYSVDKYRRLTFGWNWWPDEQPSEEIKKKVENGGKTGLSRYFLTRAISCDMAFLISVLAGREPRPMELVDLMEDGGLPPTSSMLLPTYSPVWRSNRRSVV